MFEYSSGTSILLTRTIMENRDLTHLTNIDYFREKLFRRISITSAVIERTSNGDLIGGSLGFMTARDWGQIWVPLYARWLVERRAHPPSWLGSVHSHPCPD